MFAALLFSISVGALDEGPTGGAVAATSPRSSLGRLIELAEDHSPVIRRSQLALDRARAELKTARAKFFPTLDFESSHGPYFKDPDPDNRKTFMTSSASLLLKESLYDNGANITQYKLASRKLEREVLEFELERDEQLLKLANAYYDWSAAWQDRQIADIKRDLLRRQFNVLEAQYKQGLKTKRDVLRIETEVRRLQIDLLRRDDDLEVLVQKVAAASGMDREDLRREKISTIEAKLDAPIPTGPWPRLERAEHRKSRIFAGKSREAELESRLVERDYWPQVSLEGGVTKRHSDYLETGVPFDKTRYWEWSALLKVKYNLWDWGTRRRALEISRIKERDVQSENRQGLLDLDVELREVWLRLAEFSESLKMTKELLTIEQQSYNILEAEHRNGRATYLDLITNINSLIDARSKFAATFFSLKKQQANYAFHKGTLYEDLKSK